MRLNSAVSSLLIVNSLTAIHVTEADIRHHDGSDEEKKQKTIAAAASLLTDHHHHHHISFDGDKSSPVLPSIISEIRSKKMKNKSQKQRYETLMNKFQQLKNQQDQQKQQECDPSSSNADDDDNDADVGVLSCGLQQYCQESEDSTLGGWCTSKTKIHHQTNRSLQGGLTNDTAIDQVETTCGIADTSDVFTCEACDIDEAAYTGKSSCSSSFPSKMLPTRAVDMINRWLTISHSLTLSASRCCFTTAYYKCVIDSYCVPLDNPCNDDTTIEFCGSETIQGTITSPGEYSTKYW
jgi:hypothetical protein